MAKIKVQDTEVTVVKVNNEDYFCLTDMIKAKDGDFFVTDWLRNRNTLEYLGVWERVYNPLFNYGEFALIKSQSGLNSFKISVKEFVARTNAVSLQAKAGRYGTHAPIRISPSSLRGRPAECGVVRDDRQRVARGESRIEGEYSRLRHDEPADLPLELGKFECCVYKRRSSPKRTFGEIELDRHSANEGVGEL